MVLEVDINVFNNVCSLSSNQTCYILFTKNDRANLNMHCRKKWESGGVFKMIGKYSHNETNKI